MKMVPISCPETSVRNYHYWLRNNPEEHSSHLLRGESLILIVVASKARYIQGVLATVHIRILSVLIRHLKT
jgi:hypothetical protein